MNQYGLLGAGPVSRSFIARLPRKAQELGPVAALSFRVASRIANSLRAGYASQNVSDLGRVQAILFCSNAASIQALIDLLKSARIEWAGKRILLCDTACDAPYRVFCGLQEFRDRGASLAAVSQLELPGRYLVQGDADALKLARALVRQLAGRPVQLMENREALFQAGMTMGTALFTPLLDRAAQCFRLAGLPDRQAIELAAALFERTARNFGHSGKQSWDWHVKTPNLDALHSEMGALQEFTCLAPGFRRELIAALELMGRHPEISSKLSGK